LPDINVVRDSRVAVSDSLPVIELASTSESGTRRALGISISDDVAVDVAHDTGNSRDADKRARAEPYIGQDDEVSEVRVFDEQPVRGPQLVLAWPNESERRIVTLRVIPKSEPRFQGRAVRQAFSGAGFWHGPLDIYHLPDHEGRVVLSAAALAQPGTFDPSIMDSQRFSGLNLFAVLPGPKPERETFDELVRAARQLAERLDGKMADQHGEELTSQRIARLRQALEAPPTARASGSD
jgi:FtsZ-interacting cell division protein ZipA